jgi:drug/metabolite transporter (DMT)-like permease
MLRMTLRQWVNIGLLILVNMMWGSMYVFYKKLVGYDVGPMAISLWTFVIAIFVLTPFLLWERRDGRKIAQLLQAAGPNSRSLLDRRNLTQFLIVGVVCLLPASACMPWGEQHTTATHAAILALTIPILTAPLAALVVKEKMTIVRWLSLAIALAGGLILSLADTGSGAADSPAKGGMGMLWGNTLVLVSCSASALYNVCSKDLLRRFTSFEVPIYGFCLGTIVTLCLMPFLEPSAWQAISNYDMKCWWTILGLGVLAWALPQALWMYVLTRIDVSLASISIYLLPFSGVLLAAVILGERITVPMIVGGGITLVGTTLSIFSEQRS